MKPKDPFAGDPAFGDLLAGRGEIDLMHVALEIARDAYPDLDPSRHLGRIDELAGRVCQRCRPDAPAISVLGQINWVLFVEEGLRGNSEDYHDPRNSYVNEVLDRRLGIPISLSVVYAAVASRAGLSLAGVNLPWHFVLRTVPGPAPLFIDPFHQGALLDRDGCRRRLEEVSGREVVLPEAWLAPCSAGTLVARMLRNLKHIYWTRGEFDEAYPVQRRLCALSPDDRGERRDLGLTALRLGRPGEAIDPLRRYLDASPHAEDAGIVSRCLREALRDVASRN